SVNAIAIQRDGKIVVAGDVEGASSATDFGLARYNSNGTLDTSFGSGGKVVRDFSGDVDEAQAMTLMPDGRIVVSGFTTDADGSPQFMMARFTTSGALDSTFGSGGKAVASYSSGFGQANAMAMLSDGSFVAAGQVSDWSGNSD